GTEVQVLGSTPGVLNHPPHRFDRETGRVLDACKALFLGGRDQLAVAPQRRTGVGVEGVQPQDQHALTKERRASPSGVTGTGTSISTLRGKASRSAHCARSIGTRSARRATARGTGMETARICRPCG